MKTIINKKRLIAIISTIIGFLIGGLLTSCKKEPITPGNYKAPVPPQEDTSHWQNQYTNNGTTPNWDNGNDNNDLLGTNWVVIEVVAGYPTLHTYPNDTIHFIDNNHYSVNSDTTKFIYNFYPTQGNSTISFYSFRPINSLNLTSNNIGANAFNGLSSGQEVILVLKDLYSTPVKQYTTNFKKL